MFVYLLPYVHLSHWRHLVYRLSLPLRLPLLNCSLGVSPFPFLMLNVDFHIDQSVMFSETPACNHVVTLHIQLSRGRLPLPSNSIARRFSAINSRSSTIS